MLLIECPWCGPRAETEFGYGGEAGIVRPLDPDALSDEEWADYLFNRSNPQGAHRELWNHAQGCRRWFGVERDTVSYRIERSYILTTAGTSRAAGDGTATGGGVEAEAEAEYATDSVTTADAGAEGEVAPGSVATVEAWAEGEAAAGNSIDAGRGY